MKSILLAIIALSSLAFSRTYTTAFPGTENPISQSSNWVNAGTVGIDWTNVRNTPGFVFGTQSGTDPCSAGNGCTDSTAIVSGPWGADQTVQATALVPNASTSTSVNEEIELRLRTNITAHSITGYEIICSVIANSTSGNYIQIIKWLGPLGSFTSLNGFTGHCVTGDVFKATVTGTASTVITVFKNGVTIGSATDSSSPWTSGAPGVGFFLIGTTGVNANYGFSDFTATDGIATQPWSTILSPSRATDWSTAGVSGGIPSSSWTQCGATITPPSSTAAVNAAITACGSNQYVQLAAGNFTFAGGLLVNAKARMAIRGMGADQTFISGGADGCVGTPGYVCFRGGGLNYFLSPENTANWTAGFAEGTTVITLANTTNLAVGRVISVDQTDDPSNTDNGAIFVCYTPQGVCSTNGDNGGSLRNNRSQQHMYTVTNIAGNNVTISPPLRMKNWSLSKTPQAWWASTPATFIGLENLSVAAGSGGNAIVFFNCNDCWVKGVRTIGAPSRSHVMLFQSGRASIQDNYFYKTNDSASVNYGVEMFPSGDSLVQNNIFEQVQAPYPSNASCTGCVFAYNFDVNNVFTSTIFQNQSGFAHSVGDDFFLYEGNIGSGFAADDFHGTHHLITNFRNYWNGYQLNEGTLPNQATTPLIMLAYSRFFNAIGNVLGNPARHATYASLFNIGTGNAIPNDPQTGITLMRWGNYANCSGTSPCGSSNFDSTEVPSGLTGTQASYANLVPVQTLPASFYLAAQPSWWTAGKTWPPIGPDVTGGNVKYCVGGTMTGTYVLTSGQCPGGTATTLAGGRIVSNPAMDCYLNIMGGSPDGIGAVRSFNANSCYESSSAPAVILDPTTLTFPAILVNLSSPTQPITLTNTGNIALTISSVAASGDFSQSNNCGASLSAGSFCTITVMFTPTNAGARTGSISIVDNASGSPHLVALTGTGVAPTIYRPTTFVDVGTSITSNPQFAYDGNFATAAFMFSDDTQSTNTSFLGIPALIGTTPTATLFVQSSVTFSGTGVKAASAHYSLGGGVSGALWTSTGTDRVSTLDSVVLSPTQDFTQISVNFQGGCANPGCNVSISGVEIWVQTVGAKSGFSGGNLIQGSVIQ